MLKLEQVRGPGGLPVFQGGRDGSVPGLELYGDERGEVGMADGGGPFAAALGHQAASSAAVDGTAHGLLDQFRQPPPHKSGLGGLRTPTAGVLPGFRHGELLRSPPAFPLAGTENSGRGRESR